MRSVFLTAVLLTLAQIMGPEPTGDAPRPSDQWVVPPTQGPLLLPNERYEPAPGPLWRPGDRTPRGGPLMGPEPTR